MSMANIVVPKSQIEAMQTVPPYKVTDPRHVWKVTTSDDQKNTFGSSIFKSCLNMILYFDHQEDDSGWHVAGWIKESLGRALRDDPMLSGRLRRGEDGHGDLEIVSNDSGVRLFEAKIDITLKNLLALKDIEKAESQLVFWKDIDELTPQFSPLFYVQVTNFECGGYSMGLSCSLLVGDILTMDNFVQKWAKIHRDIISRNKEAKVPIFYLPNLKAPSVNLNSLFTSTTRERDSKTVVYKVTNTSRDLKENLALFCIEEAEKKIGVTKTSPEFDFLVKESPEMIKVKNWKKDEINGKSENDEVIIVKTSDLKGYIAGVNYDEVSFREGSKPNTMSYWISSGNDCVQAVAIPSHDKLGDPSHLNIIVTIPYENESIYY